MKLKEIFKNLLRNVTNNINENVSTSPNAHNIIPCNPNYSPRSISVFLHWSYKNPYILDNISNYPGYMRYELDIVNPIDLHHYLINEGYLGKPSLEKMLNSLKSTEIKKILEQYNIPKTGKKADLIKRAVERLSTEQVDSLIDSFEGYCITKKGEDFIKQYHYYIDIHTHANWQISVDEYMDIKNSLHFNASFNDVAWGIFNNRSLTYTFEGNWGSLICNKFNMLEILKEECKLQQSFYTALEILYLQLSGMGNNNSLEPLNILFVSKHILLTIYDLKQYYDPALIDKCYKSIRLPFHYFKPSTLKNIMNDIINSTEIVSIEKYKQFTNKPKLNATVAKNGYNYFTFE